MSTTSNVTRLDSAILDRRNYSKDSVNLKKNEVLYKLTELEEKFQRFDAIYEEKINQFRSVIARVFDDPPNGSLRWHTLSPPIEPIILRRCKIDTSTQDDSDTSSNDGISCSTEWTRENSSRASTVSLESDEDDFIATTESERSRRRQTPSSIERFHTHRSRASIQPTPIQWTLKQCTRKQALDKSSCNASLLIRLVILFVVLSLVAFVMLCL